MLVLAVTYFSPPPLGCKTFRLLELGTDPWVFLTPPSASSCRFSGAGVRGRCRSQHAASRGCPRPCACVTFLLVLERRSSLAGRTDEPWTSW